MAQATAPSGAQFVLRPGTRRADIAGYGITCLTGVSQAGRRVELDAGALARADVRWLGRLITRRLPLDDFADALRAEPDDVKVVLTLDE